MNADEFIAAKALRREVFVGVGPTDWHRFSQIMSGVFKSVSICENLWVKYGRGEREVFTCGTSSASCV